MPIENQQIANNQNDDLENRRSIIWKVSKLILNIGDGLLEFSTKLGKAGMTVSWNLNANLALPEAMLLMTGGVLQEVINIDKKLHYKSKTDFIIDFIFTLSSLPTTLIVMLNRYPLPWGLVDETWLDSIEKNDLLMSFNNIPKATFFLLSIAAISRTFVVFLKLLNTLKHNNNDENLRLIVNNSQVFENNKLEKIICIIKKIDFLAELTAMINMSIFPPTFAERFGFTFKTIFDNPFLIRLGAGINIVTSVINEFNVYNRTKHFISNKINSYFSSVQHTNENTAPIDDTVTVIPEQPFIPYEANNEDSWPIAETIMTTNSCSNSQQSLLNL